MATWDAAYINDLPDSAFACIDAGGELDDGGRTVPRSLRHYPHHNAAGNLDLPHLRAALSRVAQEATTSCGVGHLRDHAQEEDVGKLATQPEHKQFAPHDLKLDEAGSITFAFAQLNVVDKDGDVTWPGAFPAKDVPMSAYGHTSWDGALPVGKGSISEQGAWAVFTGQFFIETVAGRETHATLKALGPLAEYSYSYDPLTFDYVERDGRTVRNLRGLDVYEVSPVLIGAGIGTHTLAIKSGSPGPDMPYAEHLSWLREAVEAFIDRTGEKAAWRASEGRGLSVATRAELADLVKQLETIDALAPGLAAILEATDPKRAERLHRTEIEILLAAARLNGVPI